MNNSLTIHHIPDREADTSLPDIHQDTFSKNTLGFWIYLMTDCLLFASLFVTYAVLHDNTFGGPSSRDIFSLSTTFLETMILLCSTLTCGLGVLASLRNDRIKIINWLFVTFLLGTSFVAIELMEFSQLVFEGNSWQRSGFLSSFFTLVGTHGLHVSIGLLWMAIMIGQVYWSGVTVFTFRRLVIFSMFWHFLDLVWIFIFTFVYLMGVI